jgi:hypothetical protein
VQCEQVVLLDMWWMCVGEKHPAVATSHRSFACAGPVSSTAGNGCMLMQAYLKATTSKD